MSRRPVLLAAATLLLVSITVATVPAGGIPTEDGDNVERMEKDLTTLLQADEEIKHRFGDPEENFTVRYVNFTYGQATNEIELRLEELKGLSSNLDTQPPGETYQHFNLYVTVPFQKELSKREIYFRIENSWLENRSKTEENLRVAQWNGNTWTHYSTTEVETGETYTLFRADVPALLGHYAITYQKPDTPTPTPTTDTPTTEQPTNTTSLIQVENTSSVEESLSIKNYLPLPGAPATAIGLILAALIARRD